MNDDNVTQLQPRNDLARWWNQGNTSGSVWIDFLTFFNVRLPLWWQRVWPGFFLIAVLTVSSVFVVWFLVTYAPRLLPFIDFSHVYIKPQ